MSLFALEQELCVQLFMITRNNKPHDLVSMTHTVQLFRGVLKTHYSLQSSQLTTQGPGLTAQVPGLTTQGPGLTTQVPGLTTQEPGLTTQGPGLTIQVSGLTTQGPGLTAHCSPSTVQVVAHSHLHSQYSYVEMPNGVLEFKVLD